MRLGEFRCLQRCKECDNVITNKKYKKCYRCYNKEKERVNDNQSNVEEYFVPQENQGNKTIKNPGCVDSIKQEGVVRLFYTNPNGFGPDKYEKIQMVLQSQQRVFFDGIFLSSPDRSWNSRRVETLRKKLSRIGRNIKINTSNTKKQVTNENGYLPGGTATIAWDQLADLVKKEEYQDELGRWNSIVIGKELKTIEIITFYRIVDSAEEGPIKAHAQYNEMLGEHHSTKYYRNKFLKDLSAYIKESKEKRGIKEFILLGDVNENAESTVISNFMLSNELINIHKQINMVETGELDKTFKYGSKCIDVALCTYGLIDYIEGCQLTECDEILMNDHRGYVLDINVERFCSCGVNKYDRPNRTLLDNARKQHVHTFNEKVDEMMITYQLKQKVNDLKYVSNEQTCNEIDDIFTKVLDKARAAVEG